MSLQDWSTRIDTNYFLEELWLIDHASSPKLALAKVSNAFRDLGFSCYEFSFVTNIYDEAMAARAHFCSSNEDWRDLYQQQSFVEKDPCVAHCFHSQEVFDWTESVERAAAGDTSVPGYDVLRARSSFGAQTGATIPVWKSGEICRGAFSVWGDPSLSPREFAQTLRRNERLLRVGLASFQQAMRGHLATALGVSLTRSERDCLRLLSAGYRPEQIAGRLGKSDRTINKQILSARKRLGANSRDEAVAVALVLNML
ncbi:MAG: LuxR family transcriptional regulator [Neomegalonema sp.]|nr:LuxR family transcriptional regulator [Neomegalonema sp.]